ncbi:hypothetical protein BJY01DRAFT_198518 [Aspergillus pseudoustus]|uniref:Uncharacterized protein n=1 Tax=Aspergillus pseudoustus TaxID=1810923 RepID=A0ABR4JW38_9EURO
MHWHSTRDSPSSRPNRVNHHQRPVWFQLGPMDLDRTSTTPRVLRVVQMKLGLLTQDQGRAQLNATPSRAHSYLRPFILTCTYRNIISCAECLVSIKNEIQDTIQNWIPG